MKSRFNPGSPADLAWQDGYHTGLYGKQELLDVAKDCLKLMKPRIRIDLVTKLEKAISNAERENV